MTNDAPAPFPGEAGVGVVPQVMKFVVIGLPGFTDALPTTLATVPRLQESAAAVERSFELRTVPDACTGFRWTIDGMGWMDEPEIVRENTTEIWSFVNRSGTSHPMHIHLVQFQVLDRQNFQLVGGVVTPTGPRVPPPPEESGWKDTVLAAPAQITRVIARFRGVPGFAGVPEVGQYVYHCHTLEHEDHDMMRPFNLTCYANCDSSTTTPVLNVADFACFMEKFADGNFYADCNSSGMLEVLDFSCFLARYANGNCEMPMMP